MKKVDVFGMKVGLTAATASLNCSVMPRSSNFEALYVTTHLALQILRSSDSQGVFTSFTCACHHFGWCVLQIEHVNIHASWLEYGAASLASTSDWHQADT